MEIQSYEPYHIGIKINASMPIEILRKKILPKLRESEFTVDTADELASNVTPKLEVIAVDGKNKIELNYQLSALNTIGEEPTSTTNTFKKLLSILSKLGYEIKGISTSIDIVANVFIKTDENPTKLINNSVKCDLSPWKELNENTHANGIKIDLVDEEYAKESLRLMIGPSTLSPTTQAVLTVRYLTMEAEDIIDFGNKLEERIIRFMKSFGA